MAKTVVEVVKTGSESPTNLIRRFTKRVQGSGILVRVRSLRYASRPLSKYTRKKKTLTKIARREVYEEAAKMGRPIVTKKRR